MSVCRFKNDKISALSIRGTCWRSGTMKGVVDGFISANPQESGQNLLISKNWTLLPCSLVKDGRLTSLTA